MTARVLGRDAAPASGLQASVCVVGGGMAGLLAATRLARNPALTVIVIESGLSELVPTPSDIADLNRIEDLSGIYHGAVLSRARALGGTSSLWSGKLLPLSTHDTASRPYIGLSSWPFDVTELDRYLLEIETLMGVDTEPYDGEVSELLDPNRLLPHDDSDFVLRWPKRPTNPNHQMAHVLRDAIGSLPNLEIWLGATLTRFDIEPSERRVRHVVATSTNGISVRISADEFLLAAGTLECTRLLLLADRQTDGALSEGCDAYGTYFNDHLGLTAATLHPIDDDRAHRANRALSDRSTLDALRHLHFELRRDVQVEAGVGSAYFDIGVELGEKSALTAARKLARSIRRSPLDVDAADLKAIGLDLPSLVKTAQWQWMSKQKYWPAHANLDLKIWIEQLPIWSNRIELSNQVDAMGTPMIKLTWAKAATDEATFRVAAGKIQRFWAQHFAGMCRLQWKPEVLKPGAALSALAFDQAHPAGSTRMGRSPLDSVVDVNLRVHRSSNLSIASASVFPSSGSANPTLTVLQLAMRAADAIAGRLKA